MNAGDAAEQVIRQMDKIMRNNERASRDLQFNKVHRDMEEQKICVIWSLWLPIADIVHK